jgi:hypothetical protein
VTIIIITGLCRAAQIVPAAAWVSHVETSALMPHAWISVSAVLIDALSWKKTLVVIYVFISCCPQHLWSWREVTCQINLRNLHGCSDGMECACCLCTMMLCLLLGTCTYPTSAAGKVVHWFDSSYQGHSASAWGSELIAFCARFNLYGAHAVFNLMDKARKCDHFIRHRSTRLTCQA